MAAVASKQHATTAPAPPSVFEYHNGGTRVTAVVLVASTLLATALESHAAREAAEFVRKDDVARRIAAEVLKEPVRRSVPLLRHQQVRSLLHGVHRAVPQTAAADGGVDAGSGTCSRGVDVPEAAR